MADETPTPADSTAAPIKPSYSLVGQYIRDLSFENPGAPASIISGGAQPQFTVGINVGVKKQTDDVYAVEISLNAKADRDGTMLFQVEMVYGGVFRIRNVPEDQLAPLLMVECPRLLFPFARHALANTVQLGGFPPLMMDPVDFQALFLQNVRNLQNQQGAGAAVQGNGQAN
jgi:preprotein translocase subunit SecB